MISVSMQAIHHLFQSNTSKRRSPAIKLMVRKRDDMTLSIDADCAFTYWMSSNARVETTKRRSHQTLMERIESRNLPDWAYAPDGRVHVVASNRQEYVNRAGVRCSLSSKASLQNSFVLTDGGLPIVSPECCFLRLSNDLSLHELAKAGALLCSAFSFSESGCMVGRHEPITSVNKIASYIDSVRSASGVKKARRALRFLADNAASPPEIDTYLLLCLPVMLGGYGCPLPELNGHVKLRQKVARTLGYEDCYGDLLWRDAKCIVEYTSEQFHTGYQKQSKDEIRRAALEAMGYRVYLLTKPQLYNQVAFEGFARPILRLLGKRMPKQTFEYQNRQYELRKTLLHEPSWIIEQACRRRDREM